MSGKSLLFSDKTSQRSTTPAPWIYRRVTDSMSTSRARSIKCSKIIILFSPLFPAQLHHQRQRYQSSARVILNKVVQTKAFSSFAITDDTTVTKKIFYSFLFSASFLFTSWGIFLSHLRQQFANTPINCYLFLSNTRVVILIRYDVSTS